MFRDFTEEDNTASQIALRNCLDVKEEPGYIGIFAEKKKEKEHVVEHQRITANHPLTDIS